MVNQILPHDMIDDALNEIGETLLRHGYSAFPIDVLKKQFDMLFKIKEEAEKSKDVNV